MRSNSGSFFSLLLLGVAGLLTFGGNGCVGGVDPGQGQEQQDSGPGQTQPPEPTGDNIMQVTVNGSLCGDPLHQYANQPCVAVTICPAGGQHPELCQTITNLLLDTGSFGLRVFGSVLTPHLLAALNPVPETLGDLAECVQFGDGSSEWGPVMSADVKLAANSPRSPRRS